MKQTTVIKALTRRGYLLGCSEPTCSLFESEGALQIIFAYGWATEKKDKVFTFGKTVSNEGLYSMIYLI